ncbi:efflux RND transporter permease subunit [Serratia ureilytica]
MTFLVSSLNARSSPSCSILTLIAGTVALFQLPLSEYPCGYAATVQVTASYPGANPKVIAGNGGRNCLSKPSPASKACFTCLHRRRPTAE